MAKGERRDLRLIVLDSQRALNMSQRQFGVAVGASHRTAVRWAARQSIPAAHNLRNLARLLYPHDRVLAAEVAESIDETLQSLGLEAPPPPEPPPAPTVRAEDLVDVLVLTAVETTGAAPAPMRTLLHAVFKRAREVGLTVETVERALSVAIAGAAKGESTATPG